MPFRKSKVTYALKIISKDKCCGKEQMIKNEVSILRSLRHANIIQLIEDYDTNDSLYMVMELVTVSIYIPSGNFHHILFAAYSSLQTIMYF